MSSTSPFRSQSCDFRSFPIHDIILGMRLSPEVLRFRDIVQINTQILKLKSFFFFQNLIYFGLGEVLQGWKQEKKCTWKVYLIILRKVADHREGQRGDTQGVTDIALIAVVVNLSILDPLCALGGDNHWNRFQHVHHRPPDESLDVSTFLQWLASTIQCFHYTGFHYTV